MSRLSRRLHIAYIHFRSHGKTIVGRGSRLSRRAVLKNQGGCILLGNNTQLSDGVMLLDGGGSITIGDRSTINAYSILYGNGGLTIGKDVAIGPHVVIVPANHIFERTDVPIRQQGSTAVGITIEDDVWIGAHVTVLDGAHISRGCVIAAGALVRGRTVPMGVYAGVPAALMKRRGEPKESFPK